MYKKNCKVLVIEPCNQLPSFEKARPNGTLGPAYIIGSLRRNGIETDYLDATVGQLGRDLKETFYRREELENGNIKFGMKNLELFNIFSNYDIIATSSIFTVQTRMHFEIAKIAREVEKNNNKKITVVTGGVNARSLREHFLSNGFDIVALAEGEDTIIQIVDEVSSSKPNFLNVERIAFRKDGKTIITGAKPKKGTKFLDGIPYPAIDAFPLEVYKKLGIPHAGYPIPGTMFSGIQTSRGCQDKCSFCHISQEKEERDLVGNLGFLRLFSNERVGEDVSRAVKLGVTRLYFEDDNLFFNKKRLYNLASFLKREGLTYSLVNGANLRFLVNKKPNGGYEVDEDFISNLAGFGLNELVLPFETKSQEMMNKYATGKFNPDEMNPFGIVEKIKKHGIRAGSNFLIGFRDEEWQSVLDTKKFAKELYDAGLSQVGFHIPVPFPGTKDFEFQMSHSDIKKDFNNNLLYYCDNMHVRGKPLFKTKIPAEKLKAAVKDFWLEINSKEYTSKTQSINLESMPFEH